MPLIEDLETLIRQHVSLGKETAQGWMQCRCASCDDYKERGAFKREGNSLIFNCFNCGLKTVFNNDEFKRPSRKFIELLVKFGIQVDVLNELVAKSLIASGSLTGSENRSKEALLTLEKIAPPKAIPKPSSWLYLAEPSDDPWHEVALAYLASRGLSPSDYPHFCIDQKQEGRIIIPYLYKNELIYWQGRSLDDTLYKPRYINPTVDKEKLIFNYDELHDGPVVEPLFVTEGALDAISIGKRAIALTGSTLSAWQLNELKRASRRDRKLIFVIDKNQNGYDLGNQALKEGWYVTALPDGVDDANAGRQRYGKLWLLNHLASTAVTGFAGKLLLEVRCEKRKT